MTTAKWILYAVLLAAVAGLLHYSLPGREIVRITGQEVKRHDTEITDDQGRTQVLTRDVNRIFAVTPDGRAVTYRNEDTDWGWPPYFKFDTADIAAEAANYVSSEENPRWVVVTHYGWRLEIFSMFKNLVGIRPAEGPDQPLYPWFNAIVVGVLVIGFLVIRRYVLVLYGRHVDPVVDEIDRRWDETSDTVSERYRGISGWLRRVFGQ
jgi:hypothetical protein